MVAAEITAGFGIFKSMLDTAKAIKDINDAAERKSVAIELNGQIISAQMQQFSLIEQVRDLEKKIADFETWEAEKQKYDLKSLGWGSFAYMLKPEARGSKPPHWVCANCYEDRRVSVIQSAGRPMANHKYVCPNCKSGIAPNSSAFTHGTSDPRWIDE